MIRKISRFCNNYGIPDIPILFRQTNCPIAQKKHYLASLIRKYTNNISQHIHLFHKLKTIENDIYFSIFQVLNRKINISPNYILQHITSYLDCYHNICPSDYLLNIWFDVYPPKPKLNIYKIFIYYCPYIDNFTRKFLSNISMSDYISFNILEDILYTQVYPKCNKYEKHRFKIMLGKI